MRTARVGLAPRSLLSRSAMPGIFDSRAIRSCDNSVSLRRIGAQDGDHDRLVLALDRHRQAGERLQALANRLLDLLLRRRANWSCRFNSTRTRA